MAGRGAAELKLLGGWASSFVLRVKLALHLKGLSYENVEEDLGNKSDLLLASNPVHKKVPVLIHDGRPVCESTVIVQYLDEAFAGAGPSFLPSDPYERAITRFWAAYVDDKFYNTWKQVFTAQTEEEKGEAVKQMFASMETLEGAFKECSKGKGFFGGDNVGYVDIVLGGFIPGLNVSKVLSGINFLDAAKTPLLTAWTERFCTLNTIKGVLPDIDRLVKFYMTKMTTTATSTMTITANN